jgi:hypothetical protein
MTNDGKFQFDEIRNLQKNCNQKAISIQRENDLYLFSLKEVIFSSNVDVCALFKEVQG